MGRKKLGIYDVEPKYASKLGAYLMLNEKECIEPHIFSDPERLKSCWDELDVILVPDFFEVEEDPRIVRLVEMRDNFPGIQVKKYQKARSLINEVKTYFSITGDEGVNQDNEIICVVSPSKHELQMLYSMCISKQLAIHNKTLYLNLSEYSGFLELFCDSETANLEDLLSELEVGIPFEKYVQINQGVSFIPPSKKPEFLYELDENIMMDFIGVLRNSGFEKIVVDVGSFFPQSYLLFNESDKILLLGREGFLTDHSTKEFEDNLKLHFGDEILNKLIRTNLPLNSSGIWKSEFILDELFRGNLGEYVRDLLKENE